MELKKQCISLNQSKRLKELGIEQNSIFMWVHSKTPNIVSSNNGIHLFVSAKDIIDDNDGDKFDSEMCSAFLVSEIGAMLPPEMIKIEGKNRFICSYKGVTGEVYFCDYSNGRDGKYFHLHQGDTEAEARAAMLIYLLENNIITPADCNKRLND